MQTHQRIAAAVPGPACAGALGQQQAQRARRAQGEWAQQVAVPRLTSCWAAEAQRTRSWHVCLGAEDAAGPAVGVAVIAVAVGTGAAEAGMGAAYAVGVTSMAAAAMTTIAVPVAAAQAHAAGEWRCQPAAQTNRPHRTYSCC